MGDLDGGTPRPAVTVEVKPGSHKGALLLLRDEGGPSLIQVSETISSVREDSGPCGEQPISSELGYHCGLSPPEMGTLYAGHFPARFPGPGAFCLL